MTLLKRHVAPGGSFRQESKWSRHGTALPYHGHLPSNWHRGTGYCLPPLQQVLEQLDMMEIESSNSPDTSMSGSPAWCHNTNALEDIGVVNSAADLSSVLSVNLKLEDEEAYRLPVDRFPSSSVSTSGDAASIEDLSQRPDRREKKDISSESRSYQKQCYQRLEQILMVNCGWQPKKHQSTNNGESSGLIGNKAELFRAVTAIFDIVTSHSLVWAKKCGEEEELMQIYQRIFAEVDDDEDGVESTFPLQKFSSLYGEGIDNICRPDEREIDEKGRKRRVKRSDCDLPCITHADDGPLDFRHCRLNHLRLNAMRNTHSRLPLATSSLSETWKRLEEKCWFQA